MSADSSLLTMLVRFMSRAQHCGLLVRCVRRLRSPAVRQEAARASRAK